MNTAMQEALVTVMPEAAARQSLARQIHSIEQVAAMSLDELRRQEALHEAETLSLAGRIETSTDGDWLQSATRALRTLNLHRTWIARERARRERFQRQEAARDLAHTAGSAKVQVARENAQRQRELEAARLARIKEANDENARQIRVFKEVAREVLGDELYGHIWQLTLTRTGSEPAGTC